MSRLQDLFEPLLELSAADIVAKGDAAVLDAVKTRRWPATAWIEPLGGLVTAETTHPLAAAEIRKRLTERYGVPAVARARAADARVLRAVRDARTLWQLLDAAMLRHPPSSQDVAFRILERRRAQARLGYEDVLGAYAQAEEEVPKGVADDVHPSASDLALLGEMLWDTAYGSPTLRAQQIEQEAVNAQADAGARTDVGSGIVGKDVAKTDVLFPTTYATGAVLAPLAGSEDEDQAVAQARLAGVATVVVSAGLTGGPPLFFAYRLEPQLAYDDLFSDTPVPRTNLVTTGSEDVVALTTREGYVLRASGGRYFGALAIPRQVPWTLESHPACDPGPYFAADARLAELEALGDDAWAGEDFRPALPLTPLFEQATLDYTLLQLARAEQSLVADYRRFRPLDGGPWSSAAGAALKQHTQALRPLLYQSAMLAWSLRAREPEESDTTYAQQLLSDIGAILEVERPALLMIKVDRDEEEMPDASEFVDLLAELQDGDAAQAAMEALDVRISNIQKLRTHLHKKHPDAARQLEAVHPDVLLAFTEKQRASIGVDLHLAALRDLARDAGLQFGDLILLSIGALAPPLGLAAAGLSAALGLVNVGLAFEQAEVLTVMAELDVPGGFQLGTPENAASARRWAWIGLALATLDVAWLDGNAAAQLRGAAVGMTVITPLAEALHGDGE